MLAAKPSAATGCPWTVRSTIPGRSPCAASAELEVRRSVSAAPPAITSRSTILPACLQNARPRLPRVSKRTSTSSDSVRLGADAPCCGWLSGRPQSSNSAAACVIRAVFTPTRWAASEPSAVGRGVCLVVMVLAGEAKLFWRFCFATHGEAAFSLPPRDDCTASSMLETGTHPRGSSPSRHAPIERTRR
jgi:hypothetical protein